MVYFIKIAGTEVSGMAISPPPAALNQEFC
jgi:hypothetical protein